MSIIDILTHSYSRDTTIQVLQSEGGSWGKTSESTTIPKSCDILISDHAKSIGRMISKRINQNRFHIISFEIISFLPPMSALLCSPSNWLLTCPRRCTKWRWLEKVWMAIRTARSLVPSSNHFFSLATSTKLLGISNPETNNKMTTRTGWNMSWSQVNNAFCTFPTKLTMNHHLVVDVNIKIVSSHFQLSQVPSFHLLLGLQSAIIHAIT